MYIYCLVHCRELTLSPQVGNLAGVFNFEVDEGSKVDSAVECLRSHPNVGSADCPLGYVSSHVILSFPPGGPS